MNVLVTRGETLPRGHVRSVLRLGNVRCYSKQAAEELGVKEEVVSRDLARCCGSSKNCNASCMKKTLEPKEEEITLSADEKAAAMELLRDPKLLDRVLSDFERCGVVGEETNKLVSYLAAVSRLLEKPLAIVVQSSSSAGKSSLMEAVLDFMPEEQREEYSAMTGQALFYMGEKDLKHKILAIVGRRGSDARGLRAETLAKRRRADDRLDRQRPGERQAGHARVSGGRSGDDLPDHDGAGRGRGTAESLPSC